MHILNVMFGKGLGGIEQAFVDYCAALRQQGHRVTALAFPGAPILPAAQATGAELHTIPNIGGYDPLATWRIRRLLHALKPDAAICHGNRAITLLKRARRGLCPVIGVAHNYHLKRFAGLDAAFAVSRDLVEKLAAGGLPRARVRHIPNMLRLPESGIPQAKPYRAPPVIGAMGRFVHKKGFDVLLHALALLRERGIPFRAIVGGGGAEETALTHLAKRLQLAERLAFAGWVEDKAAFFSGIDIFCLPSRQEPFGIVVLEAMAAGIPIAATESGGPSEILTHAQDGLLVPPDNAEALAAALESLLKNQARAHTLAAEAARTLREHYTMESVGKELSAALASLFSGAGAAQ